MTKTEYMNQLSKKLKKLPKDSYAEAMEYFEEYFTEAGNDEEAIANLGSPKEAADQIITNLAIENIDLETKQPQKGLSAIWIGILAIFAAPIGLPIAVALVVVILAVLITVFAVVLSFVIAAVSLLAAAVISVVGSIVLFFSHPVSGIATLGIALIALGLGIVVVCGCIVFCRWFFHKMTVLFGNLAKRGKKNENK